MFDLPLAAFLALLPIVCWADVQVSAPNCSDSSYAWSSNTLGQYPCLVAAYLLAPCNNGVFFISPLLAQHSYSGPSGSDDGDTCKCNTVAYNLISACDACQGDPWISYANWSANCTVNATAGTFPEPIPLGTRVPHWAYIDSSTSGSWNATTAQLAGDSPEVTGSASVVPSSTSSSQSIITSNTSSPSSSKSSSNTGAIAGGVVGGIIGVALIAGFVTWFTIRRSRARSVHPAELSGDQGSDMAVVPYPSDIGRLKLYDPSDPSTFPTNAPSPTILASDSSRRRFGSSPDLQPNQIAYSGLPEV